MGAGPLRHRVAIQRATNTRDEYGQPVASWSTVATRWMSIEPLTGREAVEAQQINPKLSHRVTMRYDATADVTPGDRLLWGSRVFHIESAANIEERDRYLVMTCWEEL